MYWLDGDTGEVVASVTDLPESVKQKIVYTDAVKKAIGGRKNLITLHTHPASLPPSPDDFNSHFQKGYAKSVVICHDGTIYQYESNQFVTEELFALYEKRYLRRGYAEKDAQLMTLTKLKENYAIDYWEVL